MTEKSSCEIDETNTATNAEKALDNFINDIKCLEPLNEWANSFNIFDILNITRTEIRHSNLLAWLLTPNENHGLNESIVKEFIQYAADDNSGIFDMDFKSFDIRREWQHIDILAVSKKENYLLCIENKIDTSEHDDQLARYKKVLDEYFHDYKKTYIYLSPIGTESSEPNIWRSMSYTDVIELIENACKNAELLPEAEMLIKNYVETIRRNIVGDKGLTEKCNEIYNKHKKALDLIFENKQDRASEVAEYFRNWGKNKTEEGIITIVDDKCDKTYTRFKTTAMSNILPDAEEARSAWGTKNHYFYEIVNDGFRFHLQLAISLHNISDELRAKCDEIYRCVGKSCRKNQKYLYPLKKDPINIDFETTEKDIHVFLDGLLNDVMKFEADLQAKLI